jgi:hypothetical protein
MFKLLKKRYNNYEPDQMMHYDDVKEPQN